jgi:hypothetical protein
MLHAPEIVYHYTTSAGLQGIVESQSLWATDAEFLNDAQELQYGRTELCEALSRQAESIFSSGLLPDPASDYRGPGLGGADYSRATMIRNAVEYLTVSAGAEKKAEAVPTYVTCFCEEGDLLSQWRGYGSGGGFALGLRRDALGRMPSPDQSHLQPGSTPQLVRVEYGPAAVSRMVDRMLRDLAPVAAGHPGAAGWSAGAWRAVPALASVKHEAFSEEREWRLIAVQNLSTETKFRITTYGLVPHVELPLDLATAVQDVVVGPGSHADLRALSARRLLMRAGLRQVPVQISAAPFRG